MEEYISYEEILDNAANLQSIAEKMAETYMNIIKALDKLKMSWNGSASLAYTEEFERLKNVLYPAYEELVKSILFLISVSEGYQGLESDSAKKLMQIVDYGGFEFYNDKNSSNSFDNIKTVGYSSSQEEEN